MSDPKNFFDKISDNVKDHVLSWTVTAASFLTIAQFVTPRIMDIVLDILTVVLVYYAVRLARRD